MTEKDQDALRREVLPDSAPEADAPLHPSGTGEPPAAQETAAPKSGSEEPAPEEAGAEPLPEEAGAEPLPGSLPEARERAVGRRPIDQQLAAAGLPQPPSRGRPGFGETHGAGTVPGEIVEYYEPGFGHEMVEDCAQPASLPGKPDARSAPPRRKKHRRALWICLVCAAAAGALTLGLCFGGRSAAPGGSSAADAAPPAENTEKISIPTYKADKAVRLAVTDRHGPALSAQSIYQRVNPSVVTVLVQLEGGGASVGTGVIFTSGGYILTNYHVLSGGKDCSVTLSSDVTYAAKYVAGDAGNDLAVLKVEGKNLPAAEIGSSDDLTVGDKVYAIGNPLGVELRGTFTDGIVSAINRDVDVDGRTMTLVQTNAALNSGNSGGPLINSFGQVVGINTIKMSSAFASIEGLGFAIPSSSMQYIVNDLLQFGEVLPQPLLGISVARQGTPLPDGATGIRVQEVEDGSAAQKAGIQIGDVLVSADGEAVTSSAALLRVRRRFNVGDQMTVKVYRSGEYLTFTLKLQEAAD
ncbi:MAG: trypsin-like peptidase domain-containing protein [Oscillibacter sp.]|jgi:serine protease Do|nr:trypsin-like peptidase domain-containing protein [Oscillibacter sp.]